MKNFVKLITVLLLAIAISFPIDTYAQKGSKKNSNTYGTTKTKSTKKVDNGFGDYTFKPEKTKKEKSTDYTFKPEKTKKEKSSDYIFKPPKEKKTKEKTTKYEYGETYKTTGNTKVKRSKSNRDTFLKQNGYKKVPKGYQVDHIIPLSEGGSDTPDNMQLIPISTHKMKTSSEKSRHKKVSINRSSSKYSDSGIKITKNSSKKHKSKKTKKH